jgi:hypothetical protein
VNRIRGRRRKRPQAPVGAPEVAADRRPRPADPPRPATDPSAAARPPPARRDPRPPAGTPRSILTDRPWKAPTRNLEPANPARQPGDSLARAPETTHTKISSTPEDNSARYSRNRSDGRVDQ